MSDGAIVFGEGAVSTGSIGGGLVKGGFKNLNLANILGVNAGLSTLVVPQGKVLDFREGAGGAALLSQVLLDAESTSEGDEQSKQYQQFNHLLFF